MKNQLEQIKQSFLTDAAKVQSSSELEALEQQYVGRKSGTLSEALRGLKDVDPAERKAFGQLANTIRKEVEDKIQELKIQFGGGANVDNESDLTLPGIRPSVGHLHPMTKIMNDLVSVFSAMGFMVHEGPELENDYYNFEALNFPQDHPAREMQDTFFIKSSITRTEKHAFDIKKNPWIMRAHTSNMQIRMMEEFTPPIRCVIPGRVFRNEATDASHEHTFYQLEGFVVDTEISIGNLIWTLREIFRSYYEKDVKIRLRPGYFPFVEPGYEVDMSCVFCDQKGCRVCKQTGWVEMAGAGMIHPNVFKSVGYEAGKYTGFAFGIGTMRMAMMKYGIDDIRRFHENDFRFLEQF